MRDLQMGSAVDAAPRLAFLIVGVNNTMRSSWDPVRVRHDILTCVGTLAAAGAVLLTVRFHDHNAVFSLPGVLRRPLWRRIEILNAAYDEAHLIFGGLRVDLIVERSVYERRFWSVDRLHPSAFGHRRLAHEFALGLRHLGYAVPTATGSKLTTWCPIALRDLLWLATEGAPWLGRRACDLLPGGSAHAVGGGDDAAGRLVPQHAAAANVAAAELAIRRTVMPSPPTDAASA